MRPHFLPHLVSIASLLVPLLSTEVAAAEEEEEDGARFRGAVSAEGGALLVPDVVSLGVAGVQGQLGVQINHLVGIYAVPSLDVVFGGVGGLNVAAALLVDFTMLDDVFSVGVGPDVGAFAAIGGGDESVAAAGGALYGARLRFSTQPVVGRGNDGIRRKALSIGLDVRLLGGGAGFASSGPATSSAAASEFVLAPMLTVGYQAF